MNLSKELYVLIGIGAIFVSWKYTRRIRVVSFILLRRMYRVAKTYMLSKPDESKKELFKKNDDLHVADDDDANVNNEDSDDEEESPPM